jgi:hypothetical protein
MFTCIDGGLNCVFKSLTADCELIHKKLNNQHENEKHKMNKTAARITNISIKYVKYGWHRELYTRD